MVILKDERSSHKYYIINNGAIMEIQNGTVKNPNTGVKTRLSFFYQHEGEAVHLKFNEVVSEMQKSSKCKNFNISVDVTSSSDGLVHENVGIRFIEEVKAFKSMMLERAGFLMDMGQLLQDKLHQPETTAYRAKSIFNNSRKSHSSSYDLGLFKPVRNYNLGEQKLKQIEEKERRAMADSPSKVKYKSLMDREIVIDDERLELISKFARKHTDFIKYKGKTRVSADTFDNNLEYCNMFLYKITPMVVIEMKDLVGLMEEINGQKACRDEKRVFAANLGLIDIKLKEYMDYSPRQSRRLEYQHKKRTLYTDGSFKDQRVSTSEESEVSVSKKKDRRSASISPTRRVGEIATSDSSKEGAVVKKRQKRCGKCIGCRRTSNCGKCAPCCNLKSHAICMYRRCQKLMRLKKAAKTIEDDNSRYSLNENYSDSSKKSAKAVEDEDVRYSFNGNYGHKSKKRSRNGDDDNKFRYSLNPNHSTAKAKLKRKRCGYCQGCKRLENCARCVPCRNKYFHKICILKRCTTLHQGKTSNGSGSSTDQSSSSTRSPVLARSTPAQSGKANNEIIQRSTEASEEKWKKLKRFMDQSSSGSDTQPPPKKKLLNTTGKKDSLILLNSTSDSDVIDSRKSSKRFSNTPVSRPSRISHKLDSKSPESRKNLSKVQSTTRKRLLPNYKQSSSGSESGTLRKSKYSEKTQSQTMHSTPVQEERSPRKKPMTPFHNKNESSSDSSTDSIGREKVKKNFKIANEFGQDSLDKIEKMNGDSDGPKSSRKSLAEINNYPHRKSNIFYKIDEDKIIIKWVLDKNNAKRVSGNVIWKELESKEFKRNRNPVRTWQSLRNRFLKYILCNLKEYGLSLEEEKKIRVEAFTGCIQRKKPSVVKKNMPGFSARSPVRSKGNRNS